MIKTNLQLQKELKEQNKTGGVYFSGWSLDLRFQRRVIYKTVLIVSPNTRRGIAQGWRNSFEKERRSSTKSKLSPHWLLDSAKIQPQIRVETFGAVIAYWVIDNANGYEESEAVEAYLRSYFGSDSVFTINDCAPQLPHYNHYVYNKDEKVFESARVKIHTFNV